MLARFEGRRGLLRCLSFQVVQISFSIFSLHFDGGNPLIGCLFPLLDSDGLAPRELVRRVDARAKKAASLTRLVALNAIVRLFGKEVHGGLGVRLARLPFALGW